MNNDHPVITRIPYIETGAIYRGVVTHMRWAPVKHGFCYELAMIMVNLDATDQLFKGWWPLAGVNRSFTIASFRENDHLKRWRQPNQTLKQCVQNVVEKETGQRPSDKCVIYLLTHLAYWGYCFNPVSFYYVYNEEHTEVTTIIAEVSNTPWDEMHLYILNPKVPGVEYTLITDEKEEKQYPTKNDHTSVSSSTASNKSILPTEGNDIVGVVTPTSFNELGQVFEEKRTNDNGGSSSSTNDDTSLSSSSSSSSSLSISSFVSSSSLPLSTSVRKLRYRWAKTFHVSPFMSTLDHRYDWIFTEPHRSNKLLVQSQNMKENIRMFNTQLYLYKEPLTYGNFAYMVFILFPFLTWRLQWWIHYEAWRLWSKGVELYSYDTTTTNTFTNIITGIMKPIMWLRSIFSTDKTSSKDGKDNILLNKEDKKDNNKEE